MILKELSNIVREQQESGRREAYIRNAIKEFLQVYLLFFIYTSPKYRERLIFTGGTCLRHFYGLERLSEDIDFDCIGKLPSRELLEDLKAFFSVKYRYEGLNASLRQNDNQILFKFPVLKKLGLARENDSDLLYIKADLSPLPTEKYSTIITSKSSFGMNYVAKHYDPPSLMAGKLHAILTRHYKMGGRESIKGRDYFDLLWFLKKGIQPNIERLSSLLSEPLDLISLEKQIDDKVSVFIKKHQGDFVADMAPLLKDPEILDIYVNNYEAEYRRSKSQSFRAA